MELQKILNQELQTVGKGQALSVSTGPKTGEESAFVTALHSRKINQCSDEEIKQRLRYAMIKVGLRANNFPDDVEKAVLLEHIRTNYSMHHVEEIKVAFDMATTGKIDCQVNCYENFSCTYFSSIMNAYQHWSGEAYTQLIKDQPIKAKMLPMPTDWRGQIQAAYENTPPDDKLRYKLFAPQMYDQLVTDGSLHPELYREYMRYARKEICSEIQMELSPLITSSRDEDQPKIDRLQRQLSEYRAGNRDQEIILRAKQVSVWIFFQEARRRKMPALYQRVDEPA